MACVSWDDIIWDLYEKNIQRKQRAKQRKIEKTITSSMSSEDSVSMHPEGEVDFDEPAPSGTYQVKSMVPKRRSPAPWDTGIEDSPRKQPRQASRSSSCERPAGSVVGTQSRVKTISHPAGAGTYGDWCTRDASHAGTGPSQDRRTHDHPAGPETHEDRRTWDSPAGTVAHGNGAPRR